MDFKIMKMSRTDAFSLLLILADHIQVKNEEINQAERDAEAGKPLAFFDDYGDFLGALYATKNQAKTILKDLQKQTGIEILAEEAIEKL